MLNALTAYSSKTGLILFIKKNPEYQCLELIFTKLLGLSAAGTLKWEKTATTRLSRVNEAAVRAFCAEQLGVKIPGIFSTLIGKDKTPKRILVKLGQAA